MRARLPAAKIRTDLSVRFIDDTDLAQTGREQFSEEVDVGRAAGTTAIARASTSMAYVLRDLGHVRVWLQRQLEPAFGADVVRTAIETLERDCVDVSEPAAQLWSRAFTRLITQQVKQRRRRDPWARRDEDDFVVDPNVTPFAAPEDPLHRREPPPRWPCFEDFVAVREGLPEEDFLRCLGEAVGLRATRAPHGAEACACDLCKRFSEWLRSFPDEAQPYIDLGMDPDVHRATKK